MALPGQIDAGNADQIAETLASAVSQGGTVTADMSATTFCDCAGGRAIMQAHKRAAASGAELRVVVITPQVRRLFGLLELDRRLDIVTSRPNTAPGGQTRRPYDHLSRATVT